MEQLLALIAGIAAWAGVALVAILSVNFWSEDNQILAFLPILVAVVAAWAIGEFITPRAFGVEDKEEMR